MRERCGIQDDRAARVDSLVQPADQLGFVIRLAKVDRVAGRSLGTKLRAQVLQGAAAVHVWLTAAEAAEIWAIENEDGGHAVECIDCRLLYTGGRTNCLRLIFARSQLANAYG
jgi:hypothetical protein